jgi:hypothetical protein
VLQLCLYRWICRLVESIRGHVWAQPHVSFSTFISKSVSRSKTMYVCSASCLGSRAYLYLGNDYIYCCFTIGLIMTPLKGPHLEDSDGGGCGLNIRLEA